MVLVISKPKRQRATKAQKAAGLQPPRLINDPTVEDWAQQYYEACRAMLAADKLKKKLGPLLKEAMRGAVQAQAGNYLLTEIHNSGVPDRVITRDMVGETIKGREPFTWLKVTPLK